MGKEAKNKKTAKKKEFFTFKNAIILIIIIRFLTLLLASLSPLSPLPSPLEKEAKHLLNVLANKDGKVSLVDSNGLVEEKIESLSDMGYEEIKSILGIKNDFCIFFEDVLGNIVKIDGVNPGIGSDKIYINGEPCE